MCRGRIRGIGYSEPNQEDSRVCLERAGGVDNASPAGGVSFCFGFAFLLISHLHIVLI